MSMLRRAMALAGITTALGAAGAYVMDEPYTNASIRFGENDKPLKGIVPANSDEKCANIGKSATILILRDSWVECLDDDGDTIKTKHCMLPSDFDTHNNLAVAALDKDSISCVDLIPLKP